MATSLSDKPLHDTQAYQAGEERAQWIVFAVVLTILLLIGFIGFLFFYRGEFKTTLDGPAIIGLNAPTLALILACAYLFAFRYFENLFYLFIAIGWLANAFYLPFEFLFDSRCGPKGFDISQCYVFAQHTYALSFVSSLAFYLATLTKRRTNSSYSPLVVISGWGLGILALTIIGLQIFTKVWAQSFAVRFFAFSTPGVVFSAYGLVRVGRHIRGVLNVPETTSDQTIRVLAFTFYCYSFLQLAYPFKLLLIEARADWIFISFFLIAVGIKFTNGYCLVKVLLQVKYPEFVQAKSELEIMQDRLKRRSQLAALGVISAVIEHDMKTPLAGISTRLVTLRRFYADSKARKYIDELEVDRNRLSAIAKIVPFLRGAQEYYERDRFMGRVSIYELIDRAIAAVKVEWGLNTEKFFFRINPDVNGRPQPRKIDLFVRAYTPMIEQMVVNLFKNGIEAIRETGKDTGVFTIRINAIRDVPKDVAVQNQLRQFTRWARVEIEDTGCGIPPENLPKLTSLFTTKKDRKPNSGIGLFIARILIKIHDGCMDIKSVPAEGTTVFLYLPEWDAYQEFVMLNPESIKSTYDFDEDITALEIPTDEIATAELQ
jgi:signal transduction histidine kinase